LIIYLDTSALIKFYITEKGSDLITSWVSLSRLEGTAMVTWAEIAATFAKGERSGAITKSVAQNGWQQFMKDWNSIIVIEVSEALIRQAGDLAWKHQLRGYDAMHLASTLSWQQSTGEPVTLITFDRQLWRAGKQEGLEVLPDDLSP
jgi:predicted nucleic acid-binding protein